MTSVMTGWKKLREPLPLTGDPQGAVAAKDEAEERLEYETHKAKRTAEVRDRLRELREHNHFADLIAETMYRT